MKASADRAPFDRAAFDRTVRERLERSGRRYTGGRRSVVEALVESGHPLSISDIEKLRPGLPRSSAYRHLVELQQAGIVRRLSAEDEFSRYELAEDLTEHHHHLVCVSCGRVVDVTPPKSFEIAVTEVLDELATSEGFTVQGHRLDLLGRCASCS